MWSDKLWWWSGPQKSLFVKTRYCCVEIFLIMEVNWDALMFLGIGDFKREIYRIPLLMGEVVRISRIDICAVVFSN